jgi:hypothetical protein
LPEPSFAPNLTGQRQHLRQESEKSEISEDDTSRSRAAAGREPRENVPVETVIRKKRVHQLFGHSRKVSEELLANACLKMHDIYTVEPVAEQQAGNAVAPVGGQPGQPTVNIYFNLDKKVQQRSKESGEESNGTSSKIQHVQNMIACMIVAAFLYQQNPLSYFLSQKRGEGAASGASARSPEMNTNDPKIKKTQTATDTNDAKGKTTQTATDTNDAKGKTTQTATDTNDAKGKTTQTATDTNDAKGKTTQTGTSDSPNKDSYWWDRYWSSTNDETDQDSIFKTVQEMFESIKVSASAIRIATGFDMVGYTAGGFVSIFMAQVVFQLFAARFNAFCL